MYSVLSLLKESVCLKIKTCLFSFFFGALCCSGTEQISALRVSNMYFMIHPGSSSQHVQHSLCRTWCWFEHWSMNTNRGVTSLVLLFNCRAIFVLFGAEIVWCIICMMSSIMDPWSLVVQPDIIPVSNRKNRDSSWV